MRSSLPPNLLPITRLYKFRIRPFLPTNPRPSLPSLLSVGVCRPRRHSNAASKGASGIACANAGTIWPVVTVLLLASAALVAMLQAWDYTVGLTGLFLLVGLVVLTLLVGYAVSWLLNPWMKGPQLGPSVPEDARDGDQKKAQKTPASSKRKGSALDVKTSDRRAF